MKIKKISICCALSMFFCGLSGCMSTSGKDYSVPQIDLSSGMNIYGEKYNSLFERYIIDDDSNYMAHPDTVLLKNGTLMTMYPKGHGRGEVLTKISSDGGKTWSERLTNTPKSWENSQETPTIYRLTFNDGNEKIVMISANPSWWLPDENRSTEGNGFNASFSEDDGKTWTEFKNYYGKDSDFYVTPIVAMASLTQLKDKNGNWRDAWMGVFHDANFINYKTILTFENGIMKWSVPTPYLMEYRNIEKAFSICEVEIIRSDMGQGDVLCMLGRSNGKGGRKNNNSAISFSYDEGETWTKPKETPADYSGERHKAEWLADGRLFITFRSIERDKSKVRKFAENKRNWYSEGWIAWVGTFDDLVNGGFGQYRIKLEHTYQLGQDSSTTLANGDTGYCGNAVLNDGIIFTSSYGTFDNNKTYKENEIEKLKTFIVGKRIDIKLLDELYKDIVEF